MSPELVMYLCRMNALVAEVEGMKAENLKYTLNGETPLYGENHFNGVSGQFEQLASLSGSLTN